MKRVDTFKALEPGTGKANAEKDIGLINHYTRTPLKPEEVYVFSVILCDNEIDRDTERFTNATLDALAPLFLGKTVISDHVWSAERQVARVYHTEVETTAKRNSLGEPLRVLRGNAYMLNNETNTALIEAIEGGIIKEISVGCAVKTCSCSICGGAFGWLECPNNHRKGQKYDGKLCYGELIDPTDAFEISFVAVPAQPGAGITKSAGDKEKEEAEQRKRLIADLEQQGIKVKTAEERDAEKMKHERMMKEIMEETDRLMETANKIPAAYYDNYNKPDAAEKTAFYSTVIHGGNRKEVLARYKTLGAIPPGDPSLGGGDHLLPSNMSRELLTEPIEENTLRQIEPVSQIRGLEEVILSFQIDDLALEDITDLDTAREIEMSAGKIEYGRHKTKINATISDTILHGTQTNLSDTIERSLRSGLAIKEKIMAFRVTPIGDEKIDRQSFYLNNIKKVTGDDIIQAIINAWADIPEAFAVRASCVMRKSMYYSFIKNLANNDNLWGKKPEEVIGIPVIFNDYATIPIVGDFIYSRQNYDISAIFDTDKDGKKGEYYFTFTAWSDHRIRLKSAFRLAIV